jgi:hypothetical protein
MKTWQVSRNNICFRINFREIIYLPKSLRKYVRAEEVDIGIFISA